MDPLLVTQKIVIINSEGKILAIRRSKTDPSRPFAWDLPGGLVETGEDLKEGILREVKEEVDIEVTTPEILDVFGYTSENGTYLVCVGYKTSTITTDVTLSYEHDMFEWISKDEFLSRDAKGHVKELINRLTKDNQ